MDFDEILKIALQWYTEQLTKCFGVIWITMRILQLGSPINMG